MELNYNPFGQKLTREHIGGVSRLYIENLSFDMTNFWSWC